jgi:hypothetical protein
MELKFISSKIRHNGELQMLTSKLNASALFLTSDSFIKELSEKDESMISGGRRGGGGRTRTRTRTRSGKYY